MSGFTEDLEQHDYAYLTTTGRVTGEPHRIEIWFAIVAASLWVNSGGRRRSDWVKNLVADPRLVVDIGDHRWPAVASLNDELGTHPARERLAQRYQNWEEGQRLSDWATASLLIRIDIDSHV